jgi:hypothetical protein
MNEECFDPHVDALVRQYLERQATTVDAWQVLDGVRARLGDQKPARLRRRWMGLSAAAAVVLAVLGIWLMPGGRASAEDWVRQAREVHNQPVDRCYRVSAQVEGGRLEGLPLWQKENRLWTRGNDFYVEPTAGHRNWAWGQDRQGRVWVALGRQRGVRFDAERVPEPLALVCAIRGLQIETLLDEVLADFDVRRDEAAATESGTTFIRATPRSGRSTLRAVTLEIDQKSHVIRRATIERQFFESGPATVTLSLVESQPQPDSAYTLEGHLDPGGTMVANPTSWRALLFAGRKQE